MGIEEQKYVGTNQLYIHHVSCRVTISFSGLHKSHSDMSPGSNTLSIPSGGNNFDIFP